MQRGRNYILGRVWGLALLLGVPSTQLLGIDATQALKRAIPPMKLSAADMRLQAYEVLSNSHSSPSEVRTAQSLLEQANAMDTAARANQQAVNARCGGNCNSNSQGKAGAPAPSSGVASTDNFGQSKNGKSIDGALSPQGVSWGPLASGREQPESDLSERNGLGETSASQGDSRIGQGGQTSSRESGVNLSELTRGSPQGPSGVAIRQRDFLVSGEEPLARGRNSEKDFSALLGEPPSRNLTVRNSPESFRNSAAFGRNAMGRHSDEREMARAGRVLRDQTDSEKPISPQQHLLERAFDSGTLGEAANLPPSSVRGAHRKRPGFHRRRLLSWALRLAGELAPKRWLYTHEPPRRLRAALQQNQFRILGSTPQRLNLGRTMPQEEEIGTALRSRKEVLVWGEQPSRQREEALPLTVSVSITEEAHSAGGVGLLGGLPAGKRGK